MILYNQTQDVFSPTAHYEETPSKRLDREYKKELSNISDLFATEYSKKRWEIERKCQKTFFEDEVNKILFYAASAVKVIKKIRTIQEFPMINFDFFDPRDIPQIYNECLDTYSRITGKSYEYGKVSFSLSQVSIRRLYDEKAYYISDIKSYFKYLEKILDQLENLRNLKEKIDKLCKKTCQSIFLDSAEFYPEEITVRTIKNLQENLMELGKKYCDEIEKLEYEYKKLQFRKALESVSDEEDAIIFSVDEFPYNELNIFPFNITANQVPKIGKQKRSFMVKKDDTETINDYLRKIVYSEDYYYEAVVLK